MTEVATTAPQPQNPERSRNNSIEMQTAAPRQALNHRMGGLEDATSTMIPPSMQKTTSEEPALFRMSLSKKRKTRPFDHHQSSCCDSSQNVCCQALRTELDLMMKQRDFLAQQLEEEQAENRRKDVVIASLQQQEAAEETTTTPKLPQQEHLEEDNEEHQAPPPVSSSPLQNDQEIQRWMLVEGGHLMGVEQLMTEYSRRVRELLDIPLDRFFVGGLMLHPQVSAYVWKWENTADEPFECHEIPRDVFEQRRQVLGSDAPFIVLQEGRADFVRLRSTDSNIPSDCQWFRDGGYQDYLALPMTADGQEFVGGMAWATKRPGGFSDDHIAFFQRSLATLSTVMRLHTNDLVRKTLMGRLEEEVATRTSELAAANRSLEAANRRIAAANSSLEAANSRIVKHAADQLRHFSMVSHELRTPTHAMVSMSSLLLEDTELDEQQRESVQMIVQSGQLLSSCLNDLLDYSKLASGHLDIVWQPTCLQQVIDGVLKAMQAKASSKNLQIRAPSQLDYDALPRYLETDGNRLQQILYNILGNSTKFTEENGPAIEFSVTLTEDGKMIQFVVKDYGKGIAQEDLQTIFEPFNQGSQDTEQLYGGTGLGLPIALKLAKALGGNIQADSVVGQWSEFVVTLPLIQCKTNENKLNRIRSPVSSPVLPTPSSPASVGGGDDAPFENIRVLVAEDNVINQKILHRMLQRLGVKHIDMVSDGQQAVDQEQQQAYDLCLMDIQMPRMCGIEATRRILTSRSRRDDDSKPAPQVVFVSAHVADSFQQQALDAGGSGFISKPFNLQELRDLFQRFYPRTSAVAAP